MIACMVLFYLGTDRDLRDDLAALVGPVPHHAQGSGGSSVAVVAWTAPEPGPWPEPSRSPAMLPAHDVSAEVMRYVNRQPLPPMRPPERLRG